MSKRTIFTTVTPLAPYMSRELVIETLHSHSEMIELNPLVIRHKPCKAPSGAPPDEFHCSWYELTDNVQYLPGGMLSSNVSYKACFHDLPRGLQTHVYAPTGLDIKGKWSVCGNLPHEPREPVELGLTNAPREGLYLREDVDMRCNIFMTSFVKKTLKKAHAVLVDRLVIKADLLKGKRESQQLLGSPHLSQYQNPHDRSRQSSISSTGRIPFPPPNQELSGSSPGIPSPDPRLSSHPDPHRRYTSPLASPYYPPCSSYDGTSVAGSTSGGEPSIHEQYAEAPAGYSYEPKPVRLSMIAPPRPPKVNEPPRADDGKGSQPHIAELA
ncbi:hypothetical protein FQN54_004803 [Arachnomyces sp. PD_36]|nr:hypothetical protein FQN54_004803 [Arachnomyces sp. PD_36]